MKLQAQSTDAVTHFPTPTNMTLRTLSFQLIRPVAWLTVWAALVFTASTTSLPSACGDEVSDAQAGYELLVNTPFLPPDFDEEVFDQVWRSWPRELRKVAEQASPKQRRQMAMQRYGLTVRPGSETLDPLQYVVTEEQATTSTGEATTVRKWTMNCFSCHGGTYTECQRQVHRTIATRCRR